LSDKVGADQPAGWSASVVRVKETQFRCCSVVNPSAIAMVLAFGITGGLPPSLGLAQGAVTQGAVTQEASTREFSADIVSNSAGDAASPRRGRLYVKDEKVRIEAPELPDGFFVVDGADHVAYFVRPTQRVFMDAKQASRLTRILVRVDPDDPCRQWAAMAAVAGVTGEGDRWLCERSSEGAVDGRAASVYGATSPDHHRISAWIDPKLRIALRILSDDGATVALDNIQAGPQAATLFEVPPNYAKFDPQRLIERIKQSDVWVQPPE
jgi:hypothetical protein